MNPRNQLRSFCKNRNVSINQESNRGIGEKWLDSVFILKMKCTEFAGMVNAGYKKERSQG